jgi:hypothetical protein
VENKNFDLKKSLPKCVFQFSHTMEVIRHQLDSFLEPLPNHFKLYWVVYSKNGHINSVLQEQCKKLAGF